MFKVTKYQPVEIPIPNGFTGTEITFPNQPSLYNKLIKAIEVFADTAMPYSPLSLQPSAAAADCVKTFIEFFDGSNQRVNRVPFVALNRAQDSATTPFVREVYKCNDWQISWDKCKLIFAQAPGTTGVVYTIGVYYEDMPPNYVRPIQ